jgi:hypothetical protein
MFKRRNKKSFLENFREWVWPKSGWKRWGNYLGHRVVRIPDTPFRIAAGFACGAAVSFTPFMGLHILISIALAWLLRANMVAAAIGTIVGNPWTFPFIWMLIYRVGAFILGMDASAGLSESVDFESILADPYEALAPVLGPMLVGSVPTVFCVWWLLYIPLKKIIDVQHVRRAQRIYKGSDRRMTEEAEYPGPERRKDKGEAP